jgi:hypothetical protein
MTPKFSLITALVGAALVLGVPAGWGTPVATAPDVFERAVVARELSQRAGLATMPDAFERAVNAQRPSVVSSYVDAHGRSTAGGDRQGLSTASRYPDAFERALRTESGPRVLLDSHDRVQPTSTPVVSPVDSGREIEWPQIGIGFAAGILLALGLGMTMRFTRVRQPAH